MAAAKPYIGPFDAPPADYAEGALGWHFESEPDPADAGKWRPRAWRIFYADHALIVDYRTHIAIRDTSIHAFV